MRFVYEITVLIRAVYSKEVVIALKYVELVMDSF